MHFEERGAERQREKLRACLYSFRLAFSSYFRQDEMRTQKGSSDFFCFLDDGMFLGRKMRKFQ